MDLKWFKIIKTKPLFLQRKKVQQHSKQYSKIFINNLLTKKTIQTMKKTSIILAVLTMSLVMVSCGSKQYREAKSELKSLIKEEKNAESEDELDKIHIKAWPLAVKMNDLDISDEEGKALEELLDELDKVYKEKRDSFDD